MEDLKRAWTTEQIMNEMTYGQYHDLQTEINMKFDELLSEEEKEVLKKASEMISAPYYFRLNPAHFDINRGAEAAERNKEISDTLQQAARIRMRKEREMPPNLRETINAIKQIKW